MQQKKFLQSVQREFTENDSQHGQYEIFRDVCNFCKSTMYALPQALDNPDSSLYLRDKSETHGEITYFTQKNSTHWRFLVTWLRRTYPMERVVENAELNKSAIKLISASKAHRENYDTILQRCMKLLNGMKNPANDLTKLHWRTIHMWPLKKRSTIRTDLAFSAQRWRCCRSDAREVRLPGRCTNC